MGVLTAASRRGMVRQMRAAHDHAISLNPRSFTFLRTLYADDQLAEATRTQQEVGPFVCRLYQDRYARETTTSSLGAPVTAGQRWGMLTPWHVKLVGDPDLGDEFTAPEGYFRVREVFRHALGPTDDETWGHECDVVRLA